MSYLSVTTRISLVMTLTLTALVSCSPQQTSLDQFFTEGTVRVLLLTGRNNHEWRHSAPFLKERLLESGRFDVRVIEDPAGLSSRTLEPYDVLVVDYCGPRWGRPAEQAVEKFVAGGKGLVAVHGANYAFGEMEVLGDGHRGTGIYEEPWPAWTKMVGGIWVAGPPRTSHGRRHSFEVKFIDREHPVANGMAGSFMATDELYHNPLMNPGAEVLATAFSDTSTGGTGKDEPMLWTVNYGKGRTFYTALGHNLAAMSEPGFIASFLRGCEWAATGKVTLPAESNLFARDPQAVRALVVTGGHSYDVEFYSLFSGKWIDWDHAVTNEEAFASDIRDKYDVLVLYDMSADLSAEGRKNLRNYLESGKGMVALHHAIANYQSWDWWWRDVIGGRYVLEAEKGMPASTYLHDVELFASPLGKHPVTSGIGAIHIQDETYKGMWISPEVNVILETGNETSDGPLAWISPYEMSKVIYLQLGHDRLAHLHSAYRQMVKQAVLWSAGRLD